MVTSNVALWGGVPTLFVNGSPVTEPAYITYFTQNNRYADFAGAGFRLFSMPVFFAGQTINEISKFPPFMDGIYDKDVHYEIFDREINRILEVCPDAMIFPRVNCSLPREWEDAHPDELCDTCHRASFSSDLWLEETKRLLTGFVNHVGSSPFADHIIGYQIAGGNTEEWFPFDQAGSVGLRAREKYAALTGKFYEKGEDYSEDPAFYDFLSTMVARRIDQLAAHVKTLVGGTQVVGAFYGYTLECPWRWSAHQALGELLHSESVDFICSPYSNKVSRYGEEGVTWKLLDPAESEKNGLFTSTGIPAGIEVIKDEWSEETKQTWHTGVLNCESENGYENGLFIAGGASKQDTTSRSAISTGNYRNALATGEPAQTVKALVYTAEEQEVIDTYQAAYKEYMKEARAEFITGAKDPSDDAQWEAYLKELEANGLEELLEVVQNAWTRMQALAGAA